MSAMGSQITSVWVVYSTVCSGAYRRIHQSSVSLAFVRGIHRWPVTFPHKGPVTRKMVPWRHHDTTSSCWSSTGFVNMPRYWVLKWSHRVEYFNVRENSLYKHKKTELLWWRLLIFRSLFSIKEVWFNESNSQTVWILLIFDRPNHKCQIVMVYSIGN